MTKPAFPIETVDTDFLVIGGGVAGLRAAVELAPHGRVLVVTKDRPTESATEYAQGGIAAVLSDEDEIGFHMEDTLRAGNGLCDEEAVRILVEEGPAQIEELIAWGAAFDRVGEELALTREGAHSRRRVVHARGDSTGQEIQQTLLSKVQRFPSVSRLAFACTVDLLLDEGRCVGAVLAQEREERILAVRARTTLLATGGAGQLYLRTTNPPVATGDGMAIAYRAGATLRDMEFIQFHPTSLYYTQAPQFLLSEAMRGEGAILRNLRGEAFMSRYHPQAELAARDVVSRAIWAEMQATLSSKVFLDLTHLDKAFVRSRFPRIYATCLRYDLDISEDWIPVCPAAHYVMGGVKTGVDGQTDLPGLFAAGEVACVGVHGANRLASNSLLEGLVFGARSGRAAARWGADHPVPQKPIADLPPEDSWDTVACEKARADLRKAMWNLVGIVRSRESLEHALRDLKGWEGIREGTYYSRTAIELKNLLTVAELITRAALKREGSVGAHYRSDFPERGAQWQTHFEWRRAHG
jgi:L-aspartate oxidase